MGQTARKALILEDPAQLDAGKLQTAIFYCSGKVVCNFRHEQLSDVLWVGFEDLPHAWGNFLLLEQTADQATVQRLVERLITVLHVPEGRLFLYGTAGNHDDIAKLALQFSNCHVLLRMEEDEELDGFLKSHDIRQGRGDKKRKLEDRAQLEIAWLGLRSHGNFLELVSSLAPKAGSNIVERFLKRVNVLELAKKQVPFQPGQLYFAVAKTQGLNPEKIDFLLPRRDDIAGLQLDLPLDWLANPFNDYNWLMQLQMWRPIDSHLRQYERTGNSAWLAEPIRTIEDWEKFFRHGHNSANYVWTDMVVGMRAMKLAFFLALHQSGQYRLDKHFLRVCHRLARKHVAFLMDSANLHWTNHTFVDLQGMMALARVLPAEVGASMASHARHACAELLQRQFDPNGAHLEHSPHYQHFALGCLDKLKKCGGFNGHEFESCQTKAKNILQWLTLPDYRLAPLGDTDNRTIPAGQKGVLPQGALNQGGYVIHRHEKDFLLLMCARHSLMHKHADDLAIFWHSGEDILCDSGKYAYQPCEAREYALSPRAHNCLEVDGCVAYSRGFFPLPREPYVKPLVSGISGDLFYGAGLMFIPQFNLTQQRAFVLCPGNFLLVLDRVWSSWPHELILNWHFPASSSLEFNDEKAQARLASGNVAHMYWQSTETLSIKYACGQTKPVLQGFCSDAYKKIKPSPCLGLAANCSGLDVVCAFSLGAPAKLQKISRHEYEFCKDDRKLRFSLVRTLEQSLLAALKKN